MKQLLDDIIHFGVVADTDNDPSSFAVLRSIGLVDDRPNGASQYKSPNEPYYDQAKCVSFDVPIYIAILVTLGFSGLDLFGIFLLNFCYSRQYPPIATSWGFVILLSSW